MELKGGRELQKALDALERKTARQVTRKALREGAKLVQAAAKEKAPKGETERLRQAIRVRAGRRKPDRVNMLVTVGKKWFTGDEYYGAFVEFGHHIGKRVRRKEADTRTWWEGKHFVRDAYEEKNQAAASKVTDEIAKGIERAVQEAKRG